jgi:hypothetical protein
MRLSLCALSLSAVVLNQFTPVHAPFGKSKIAAQTSQSIMLAAIIDTAYTQGADPLLIEICAKDLSYRFKNQNFPLPKLKTIILLYINNV